MKYFSEIKLISVLSVVLLVVYLIFANNAIFVRDNYGFTSMFDWPDETANYFWIQKFANENRLFQPEPLNSFADNQIHPRSINVRLDGTLVPGSFLGFIVLFGTAAKLIGSFVIYITPLLAILAILAFYQIIRHYFSAKIAVTSTILLALHPAWFYYSVTSLLPNVPFLAFAIFGIYFLVIPRKWPLINLVLAGALYAVAIVIRPSELVWLTLIYGAAVLAARRKFKVSYYFAAVLMVAMIITPILMLQNQLYGAPLISGYDQLHQLSSQTCKTCEIVKSLVVPFGIHPRAIINNLWQYVAVVFAPYTIFALFGLIYFSLHHKKLSHSSFGYIGIFLAVSAWLGVYYGSWVFSDIMTLRLNTLGISYVRYFLPIYILMLPLTALGIFWFCHLFKKQKIGIILTLSAISLFSLWQVLFAYEDSIFPVKHRIAVYYENAKQITDLTEEESVLIVNRKDKVIFPMRKVIHTFEPLSENAEALQAAKSLASITPTYYLALERQALTILENSLELEYIAEVGDAYLYKVYERANR